MRHDWNRPHPPVYPAGVNSIETRVRLLEQARVYDGREMERHHGSIDSLARQMSDMQDEQERRERQLMLWVIATLVTCLGGLGTVVLKLMFPSAF